MGSIIVLFALGLGTALLVRYLPQLRKESRGENDKEDQAVVLWCEKGQEDITELLTVPQENDVLFYEFYQENGEYFFKAKGVRGIANIGSVPELYRISFLPSKDGTQLQISAYWKGIYKTKSELYEFFRRKLGCVPAGGGQDAHDL